MRRLLALGLAAALLALASCSTNPDFWRPPPDYDRGPQRHPGQ
jgi:hypothetical protein